MGIEGAEVVIYSTNAVDSSVVGCCEHDKEMYGLKKQIAS
jgi:hypothetical protein